MGDAASRSLRQSHLDSLFTLSASSPILFIHLSTNSLFSSFSFFALSSARFICSPCATISSCASSTNFCFPLSSSSRSFNLLSNAVFCCDSCAIWDVDRFCWSSRSLREVVSSVTWDWRVERAFCVVARSARRRVRSSEVDWVWAEGTGEEALLREGILTIGGGAAGIVGCDCGWEMTSRCESRAVRSASLVSALS